MSARPKSGRTTSAGEIGQLCFSERSAAQRNTSVGPSLIILGAIGTAVRVGQFANLLIVNSAATAAFVAFGDSTVAAPSTLANGIWLPPSSHTFLSSGLNTYVRASAATVGAYKADEFVNSYEDANIDGAGV